MSHDIAGTFPVDPSVGDLVRRALAEDVGSGDATTAVTVEPGLMARGTIRARDEGVVAGLPLVALVYAALEPSVVVDFAPPQVTVTAITVEGTTEENATVTINGLADDDATDGVVIRRRAEGVVQLRDDGLVQGVHRVRAI